jgi:hypothetical protein
MTRRSAQRPDPAERPHPEDEEQHWGETGNGFHDGQQNSLVLITLDTAQSNSKPRQTFPRLTVAPFRRQSG